MTDPRDIADADAVAASVADPAAFAEVFERHYDAVRTYLVRRLGADVGDDLAAEVFVRAFPARHGFTAARGTVRGWLLGIATNLARQHWRAEERRLRAFARTYEPAADGDVAAADSRVDAQRLHTALAAALAGLRKAERDVLLLHAWAGLSHDEIAAALDLPPGTVRSRLSRARRRLRERLGDIGEHHVETSTEKVTPWTSST